MLPRKSTMKLEDCGIPLTERFAFYDQALGTGNPGFGVWVVFRPAPDPYGAASGLAIL